MAKRRKHGWDIDDDYQEYEDGRGGRMSVYRAAATRGGDEDEPKSKQGCAGPFFFVIVPGLAALAAVAAGLGMLIG
jgi:hypothetical protein